MTDHQVIESIGAPGSAQRTNTVARLTVVGWLLLGAEFGFIGFQIERVRSIGNVGTQFASALDRRIEVLSFLMLPPNIAVLAPAALVAVVATLLAGHDPDPWLATLLRLVAAIAILMFFIGIPAIGEIATREGQGGELDSVFMRLGGMSFAAGIAVLCRWADTVGKSQTA